MEHRWGQRVPVGMKVRLSCLPYSIGAGRLRDISVSGAFIETNLSVPLLARVHLEVDLPFAGRTRKHSIPGHVARDAEDGIGIEWLELAPPAVAELLIARAAEVLIDGDIEAALRMRQLSDCIVSNAAQFGN